MSQGEGTRPEGGGELSEPLVDPRAPWEELVEDPNAPRMLLAVLFTDIVGSTELATALGDKRWREVLEQHDAAIRAQLTRFGGREVDTAGDAFFCTFALPVRAVDCALESMRAVRRVGLRIRAGVHMGECVVSDGKVRGVSVHIGARVAAKARGDELLVSSTVRDILAGAGLKFVDRGEQTLKGVDGRWRLHAVEPRERDNEADLPPLLEAEIAKPPLPWWKQGRTVIAATTALAVLIGAVAFVTLRGPSGLQSVGADSLAVIDASSGDVTSATTVGRRPTGVAVTRSGVWVANSIDRSVSRVDRGGQVLTVGPLGVSPSFVTATDTPNLVWVGNADEGTVSRVSPDTRSVVGQPIRIGNGLSGLTYGGGSIWVTNAVDGTVVKLEPKTGQTLPPLRVGPALRGIIATKDAVWVVSETAGTVSRIDPTARSVVQVIPVGHGPRSLALGAGGLWVTNAFDGTVSRIDPEEGKVVATVRVGSDPRSIAIAGGRIFVANETDGTISVIEPQGNKVTQTIALANSPMGLAADGNRVWVSVRGGTLRYRGGTLRFVNPTDDFLFSSIDPMHAWNPFGFAIATAVYDTLLAFKKVGGLEGSVILPDLAEELVPPTDDGKTYSFRLRRDLKFSSGAAVKASDVRKSFERMFRGDGRGKVFFGTILGTEACKPLAPCDLSRGIVIDDTARTVIFHLRQAAPEFPFFLAIPLASILPGDTPAEDAEFTPIPGTGPYAVAKVTRGGSEGDEGRPGELTLERNKYFVPRGLAAPDGYPDRILATWNGDGDDSIDAVKEGRGDTTLALEFSDRTEQLSTEVPGQFHIFEPAFTRWVSLNENIPPLNDVRVRRAINYAVDRKAMAQVTGAPLSGALTCQILPPGIIGHVPYCPYTVKPGPSGIWNGPDLATARRLVAESGTRGQQITLWADPDHPLYRVVGLVADAMRKIGYRPVIRNRPGDEIFNTALDSPKKYQSILGGWFADFPSPSNFMLPAFACPAFADRALAGVQTTANTSWFCSDDIDKMMADALDAMEKGLLASADLWTAVDRAVIDAAPVIPYSTQRIATIVSPRLGNVQYNLMTGLLLSQMWLTDRK
ncbi:MAG: ABC transporter substrate-binding protein [Actinomycetota bacterium]